MCIIRLHSNIRKKTQHSRDIHGTDSIQYIPRIMHTAFALLCFVVVIHWLIFPYPSGLLHWHCGPSASKATLMNMDKYFMWIHYERLHYHNKANHNKTVCIFLRIYCMMAQPPQTILIFCSDIVVVQNKRISSRWRLLAQQRAGNKFSALVVLFRKQTSENNLLKVAHLRMLETLKFDKAYIGMEALWINNSYYHN